MSKNEQSKLRLMNFFVICRNFWVFSIEKKIILKLEIQFGGNFSDLFKKKRHLETVLYFGTCKAISSSDLEKQKKHLVGVFQLENLKPPSANLKL